MLAGGVVLGGGLLLAALLAGGLTGSGSTPATAAERSTTSPSESATAEDYGLSQVATINKYIRQGWVDSEFTPSKPATDGEWLRRLYLDVLGRIPSVDDLDRFQSNRSPRRKLEEVNRLLGDDYVEEYARNWTTIWTNILIGRSGGTERRTLTSRPGMQQYVRRCFQRNKPYDTMVGELITATGTTKPGSPSFNGATNFLAMKYEEKAAQATAKTAQIFLGMQVQCTQCHNHPFNDAKQNQFWEMNAFFRQSRPLRTFGEGRDVEAVELVDESWPGEDNNPSEAILYYELRNGLLKSAYPVFVDGTALTDTLGEEKGRSGYLEDVNRRQELAKLIVASPLLGKTIVNRYWGHFLGYGFTKPVDDLGPHNPPTHPELLEELGAAVASQSYDLKQLIRWITLSEAYGLSSRMNATNKQDDPSLGERPMFSHFYLRQMRAEELYESLLVATEAHKASGSYEKQEAAKQKWLSQFVQAFGTDEGDEMTTFNGTIPQSLMMMNGELVKKATSSDKGSFLDRVARNGSLSNSKKINYLYLAALSRQPTSREVAVANQLLAGRKGNIAWALQDIWWVLLNSNEFILNH